jgi:hypothetical protein
MQLSPGFTVLWANPTAPRARGAIRARDGSERAGTDAGGSRPRLETAITSADGAPAGPRARVALRSRAKKKGEPKSAPRGFCRRRFAAPVDAL